MVPKVVEDPETKNVGSGILCIVIFHLTPPFSTKNIHYDIITALYRVNNITIRKLVPKSIYIPIYSTLSQLDPEI